MQYNLPKNYLQRNKDEGTIKVLGEGKFEAQPDRVTITIGVLTESKNLSEAQQNNANKTASVINSLLNLGIVRENIRTIEYQIEPIYQYEEGEQIFKGYRVIHLLSIINDEIDKTGILVDTAVANGANRVNNIEFTSKNIDQLYQYSLSSAVVNSIRKAETIARTLNVRLDPVPVKIIELHTTPSPIPFQTVALEKSSAATPIEPGKLTVTASIEATFHYQ